MTTSRATGILILNEFGNGFVNLASPPITVYIPKNKTSRAYHLEQVEIEYTPEQPQTHSHEQTHSQTAEDTYTGRVINYTLVGKTMVGIVHHIFKTTVYIYVPELKLANLVQIQTPSYLEKGNWIQLRITQDTLEPNQVIGELLQFIPNDINYILAAKYNLTSLETYPESQPAIQTQLTALQPTTSSPHLEIQERDQTYLETLTIDPPSSLDCDDAFSIEHDIEKNFAHIYVHIANVAYYFNPLTTPPELWNEIVRRGTTFYGTNGINWPMIPGDFANGICSILPGKQEPTHVITCEFHYNLVSQVLTFIECYPSIVASKAKLDYDTVDCILADTSSNSNATICLTLQILLESAQVIRARSKDFILTPETPAHWLVRYWMILVNTVMCRDIYRYNAIPDMTKQETLIKYIKKFYPRDISNSPDSNSAITISRDQLAMIINSHTDDDLLMYLGKVAMQKSYYTTNPAENYHYGIGAVRYTHWTSPIRRLPDLINHCQLLGITIPQEEIARYMDASNAAELKQDQIERFITMWKNQSGFSVGSLVHGVIINVSRVGVSVYMYELQTRYSIHISKLSNTRLDYDGESLFSRESGIKFELFTTLQLRISKIFFDVVEFDIAS